MLFAQVVASNPATHPALLLRSVLIGKGRILLRRTPVIGSIDTGIREQRIPIDDVCGRLPY